jgi:hypothetical protein
MSASLAIALFSNAVALGVLMIPKMFGPLSKNQFADLVLKRCCIVISLWLFMMNSAIMLSIATTANIPVGDFMTRYLWFFGIAGWVGMIYLIIKTIFDLKELYKKLLFNKRMGGQNG